MMLNSSCEVSGFEDSPKSVTQLYGGFSAGSRLLLIVRLLVIMNHGRMTMSYLLNESERITLMYTLIIVA